MTETASVGTKQTLIEFLGTDAGRSAVAGALGGLVRWITMREHPKEAVWSLIAGSVCAIYLGPIAIPLIEPVIGKIAPNGDAAAAGFSSFIIGLGGISISAFIIEIIKARGGKSDEDKEA